MKYIIEALEIIWLSMTTPQIHLTLKPSKVKMNMNKVSPYD